MRNVHGSMQCCRSSFESDDQYGHFKSSFKARIKKSYKFRGNLGLPLICTYNEERDISLRSCSGEKVCILGQCYDGAPNCVVFDGSMIWVGFSTGVIHVYDGETFKLVKKIKENSGGILCFAYCLDSIFSGGHGWTILRWSCASYKPISSGKLQGHTNAVRVLANEFQFLYSAGDDCTVRCWRVSNQKNNSIWVRRTTKSIRNMIVEAFHLVCSQDDGCIILLSKQTGEVSHRIENFSPKCRVFFSEKDSYSFWVASTSGKTCIWDRNLKVSHGFIECGDSRSIIDAFPINCSKSLKVFTQSECSGSIYSIDFLSEQLRDHERKVEEVKKLLSGVLSECLKQDSELQKTKSLIQGQQLRLQNLERPSSQRFSELKAYFTPLRRQSKDKSPENYRQINCTASTLEDDVLISFEERGEIFSRDSQDSESKKVSVSDQILMQSYFCMLCIA